MNHLSGKTKLRVLRILRGEYSEFQTTGDRWLTTAVESLVAAVQVL